MAELIAVDDEPALCRMLEDALPEFGHEIRTVSDAPGLARELAQRLPDLVLLDIGLGDGDGIDLARGLRAAHDFGIIMLTGADQLEPMLRALDSGADDYVTKPFSMRELNARIQAVLRRRRMSGPGILALGTLSVDLKRWRVMDASGSEIALFPTEIDLIAAFASNPGRVLQRDDLLQLAPGHSSDPLDRSIDSRIARLRRKLAAAGHDISAIEMSRGAGYIYRGSQSNRD